MEGGERGEEGIGVGREVELNTCFIQYAHSIANIPVTVSA